MSIHWFLQNKWMESQRSLDFRVEKCTILLFISCYLFYFILLQLFTFVLSWFIILIAIFGDKEMERSYGWWETDARGHSNQGLGYFIIYSSKNALHVNQPFTALFLELFIFIFDYCSWLFLIVDALIYSGRIRLMALQILYTMAKATQGYLTCSSRYLFTCDIVLTYLAGQDERPVTSLIDDYVQLLFETNKKCVIPMASVAVSGASANHDLVLAMYIHCLALFTANIV